MYDTALTTSEATGILASLFVVLGSFLLVIGIVAVFTIICRWIVLNKAGKPGWAALIPVYGDWEWLDAAGMRKELSLLGLAPIAFGLLAAITGSDGSTIWDTLTSLSSLALGIILIVSFFKIAPKFKKSSGFGVGLWLLYPIFIAILAFDKSKYSK